MSRSSLALTICALALPAFAQDAPTYPVFRHRAITTRPKVPDDLSTDAIAGRLTFGGVSQSLLRGLPIEDRGVLFHTNVELSANLVHDEEGTIRSFDLVLGAFSALHSHHPDATNSPRSLDETDFYFGGRFDVSERWAATAVYNHMTFPNSNAASVEEMTLGLAYDDRGQWELEGFTGFQPSFLIAFELDGQIDGGTERGTYYQIGMAPGFDLTVLEEQPVALAFPVTIAFGSDYYEGPMDDESFGFLDIGAAASTPLTLIPERFGAWDLTASIDAVFLGDSNELRNGGDDLEIVAGVFCGVNF